MLLVFCCFVCEAEMRLPLCCEGTLHSVMQGVPAPFIHSFPEEFHPKKQRECFAMRHIHSIDNKTKSERKL